jgi:hypothetical protein
LQAAKEAVKADNPNIDENSREFNQALRDRLVANPIRTFSPAEPDERKAMLASGKNSYFTATITALLACDQLSTYLASSLNAIAFNPDIPNPTTW